jgi:hypothetical protein
MERSKEYEPLILDLQKSKIVPRSRRHLFLSVITVAVLGTVATFIALYNPKPKPDGLELTPAVSTPVPTATVLPAATPTAAPTVTPLPTVKKSAPTPKRAESVPTVAPTVAPTDTVVPIATVVPTVSVTAAPTVISVPTATAIPTVSTPSNLGTLNLTSIPADAEVLINGKLIGRTPVREYALKAGVYTVKFVYQEQSSEQRITLTAGKLTELTYRFEGFGSIQIQATRSGSDIFVNGEFAGLSPFLLEGLEPGTYTIIVRRTGYAMAEKTVTLAKGEHQEVLITIRPLGLNPDPVRPPASPSPEHPSDRLHR